MSTEFATKFSHVRPQDTSYQDQGLRDFFLYRDLGVAQATGGKVLAQPLGARLANMQRGADGAHRGNAISRQFSRANSAVLVLFASIAASTAFRSLAG